MTIIFNSYLWKRGTVLISVTAAVVLIYTFGFSSEVHSFLQPLPVLIFWDNEKRPQADHTVH